MKSSLQYQLFFAALALAASSFFLSSCSKPPDREAVISPKISQNLVEMKSMPDFGTTQSGEKMKMKDNTFLNKAIAKLKKTANVVTEALNSETLEFLILNDRMLFYKKVKADEYNLDAYTGKNIYSERYLLKLKQIARTDDSAGLLVLNEELSTMSKTRPALEGYVLIGMIRITAGILEKEKTDYDEKKSILNISSRTLQFATHIVLGAEIPIEEELIAQETQKISE